MFEASDDHPTLGRLFNVTFEIHEKKISHIFNLIMLLLLLFGGCDERDENKQFDDDFVLISQLTHSLRR